MPSRRLLPLAALSFVLMATEGSVGDWSGTYLARSGVEPGRDRRRLRGLFASDDHRQDCRRRNRRRRGSARDGWLWRSPCRSGARDQRRMAGACWGRHRLRTGWRGPRQCRACPLQRRRADRVIAGGRRRLRRDLRAMRACLSGRSSSALSLPALVCARRSSCWRAWRCFRLLFAASKAGGLRRQ